METVKIKLGILLMTLFFIESCSRTLELDLGGGYIFISDSNDESFIINRNAGGRIVINPTVRNYNYNDDFILLEREVTDFTLLENPKEVKGYKLWIIDKRDNQVYGPLNYSEFKNLREKLNIPDKLTLKI